MFLGGGEFDAGGGDTRLVLSRDDIAEVMEVSTRTIDRELRFGRAWLAERLGRELEA